MIQWILTQVFSLLGGPFAQAALKAYQAKLSAENSTEAVAAGLAAQELQVQAQIRIAEIGHWYEPDKVMGYCVAALVFKLIVWDTILQMGTTNLHDGWMTGTANLIIGSYFGMTTVSTATRVLTRFLASKR